MSFNATTISQLRKKTTQFKIKGEGDAMWIDDWRHKEKITVTKLAKMLKTSRTHLSKVISGATQAGPDLAKRIVEITGGEVSLEDILYGDKAKRKLPPKERK